MKRIHHIQGILVLLIFVCGFTVAYHADAQMGQSSQNAKPYSLWLDPGTDDFATIQQNVENYYANINKSEKVRAINNGNAGNICK